MTMRLLALDRALDLGTVDATAIKLFTTALTPTIEGQARYYIDTNAVAEIERLVDDGLARKYKEKMREHFVALDVDQLQDELAEHLIALPDEMQTREQYDALRPSLETLLDEMHDNYREQVLEVTFGLRPRSDLTGIAATKRQELIVDLYRAMPREGADTSRQVLYDFSTLALALGSKVVQKYGLRHPANPIHTENAGEPPTKVVGKAIAATVADAALRALFLSAPREDLEAVFEGTFDDGYWNRLVYFHDKAYRDQLVAVLKKNDVLQALRHLVDKRGPSDVVILDAPATHALQVHIKRGRELAVGDLKSSDPYCVLTIRDPKVTDAQTYTTDYVASTLEPTWDEQWAFAVTLESVLRIAVMDRDALSADDAIGIAEATIADFEEVEPEDRWLPLDWTPVRRCFTNGSRRSPRSGSAQGLARGGRLPARWQRDTDTVAVGRDLEGLMGSLRETPAGDGEAPAHLLTDAHRAGM